MLMFFFFGKQEDAGLLFRRPQQRATKTPRQILNKRRIWKGYHCTTKSLFPNFPSPGRFNGVLTWRFVFHLSKASFLGTVWGVNFQMSNPVLLCKLSASRVSFKNLEIRFRTAAENSMSTWFLGVCARGFLAETCRQLQNNSKITKVPKFRKNQQMASKSHNFQGQKNTNWTSRQQNRPGIMLPVVSWDRDLFGVIDRGIAHLKSQQKPLSSTINLIYTRHFTMLVPNFWEKQRLQNPIDFILKFSSFSPADFGDERQDTSANSRIESKMWRTFGARWDSQENRPSWWFKAFWKIVLKLEHLLR